MGKINNYARTKKKIELGATLLGTDKNGATAAFDADELKAIIDGNFLNSNGTPVVIVDNLASDSATSILSAKQGKKLNEDKVDKVTGKVLISAEKESKIPSDTAAEIAALTTKINTDTLKAKTDAISAAALDATTKDNALKALIDANTASISGIANGHLGTLEYDDPEPKPGQNGIYTFSTAGTVTWLGNQAVKIGDEVSVKFSDTDPDTYVYTYINNQHELSDSITSDSITVAASSKAVKTLNDKLSNTSLLSNGTDLNTIKDNGIYNGSALVNAPTSDWVWIEVKRYSDVNSFVSQRATSFGYSVEQGLIWERNFKNSTWSSWRVIYTSDNESPLFNTTKIADGTDLNTIDSNGNYNGSSLVNSPTSDYIWINVVSYSDDKQFVKQEATSFGYLIDHGVRWIRYKDTGVWSDWIVQSDLTRKDIARVSRGKNLLAKDFCYKDKWQNPLNADYMADVAGYIVSNNIPAEVGDKFCMSIGGVKTKPDGVSFYNKNGVLLEMLEFSGIPSSNITVTKEGTAFMRIAGEYMDDLDTLQVESGHTATSYTAFLSEIGYVDLPKDIAKKSDAYRETISGGVMSAKKIVWSDSPDLVKTGSSDFSDKKAYKQWFIINGAKTINGVCVKLIPNTAFTGSVLVKVFTDGGFYHEETIQTSKLAFYNSLSQTLDLNILTKDYDYNVNFASDLKLKTGDKVFVYVKYTGGMRMNYTFPALSVVTDYCDGTNCYCDFEESDLTPPSKFVTPKSNPYHLNMELIYTPSNKYIADDEVIFPVKIFTVANDIKAVGGKEKYRNRNSAAAIYLDHMIRRYTFEPKIRFDNGSTRQLFYSDIRISDSNNNEEINNGVDLLTKTVSVRVGGDSITDKYATVKHISTKNSATKAKMPIVLVIGDSITDQFVTDKIDGYTQDWNYTLICKELFEKDRIDNGSVPGEYEALFVGGLFQWGVSAKTRSFSYDGQTRSIRACNFGWPGISAKQHADGDVPQFWDPVNLKWSLDYYVNNYKTVDNGVRLERDEMGPLVTNDYAYTLDLCLPTHVFIQLGANDINNTNQQYVDSIKAIVDSINTEHPEIYVGVAITDSAGTYFPSLHNNCTDMCSIWNDIDGRAGARGSRHDREFELSKALNEGLSTSGYEAKKVTVLPNYFITPPEAMGGRDVSLPDSIFPEMGGKSTILDNRDSTHVGAIAHVNWGYQLYSWIKSTLV